MPYEDDRYRDEDGEPLMDFDEIQSDDDDDDILPPNAAADDDGVHDFDESKSKSIRKRLIKKSDDRGGVAAPPPELNDFDDEDVGPEYGSEEEVVVEEERAVSKKRKDKGMMMREDGGEKRRRKDKKLRKEKFSGKENKVAKLSLRRKKGGGGGGGDDGDPEMKEMWDTIAGGDSEDDQEGLKTVDDDNFIDDSGLDPNDRYGSDRETLSPSRFAQAEEGEEDDEIRDLFKPGKKKKKNEKSAAEIAELVETLMAELEVVAEEDCLLNSQGKPAINKLRKLPLLTEALSKKQLQLEFLDHGVLTLLKNWLEPLPDGSLPNFNIREAILRILTDFPIDIEQIDRREQLKKSGLGKVIMFLSRSDEETTSNRKLAKDLVDKWSRPIFNKSTRFEDMRHAEEERIFRRPSVRKPANKASEFESRDDDLEFSSGRKAGPSASMQHASRPEATPMDFHFRPQSKIDPDEIRARAKAQQQDERRMKMNKKMQQLKQMKKKKLQATKVSVEGRGMVKYF